MPEGERTVRQRIQEQTVRIARDYYGDSLGRLEGVLQGDRAQLEDLAEQLPEGDAEARIRNMAGSYSKIEESLHRTTRDVGAEDAVGEAARQAQEEAAGEPERAVREARDAAGAAAGRVTGAVGQASGQVGQIGEDAQEAVGQVLDWVGQVAENLPGGQLLNRTTNEAGQTVQRAVDESGVVVEITLDETCNLVNQKPVGSLAELRPRRSTRTRRARQSGLSRKNPEPSSNCGSARTGVSSTCSSLPRRRSEHEARRAQQLRRRRWEELGGIILAWCCGSKAMFAV